ncbi:MAG: hypothetical protein K2H50_05280, partial [Paramuribaculum sp.]|nr:hypothetical protein [Paramuribaculum sp.]
MKYRYINYLTAVALFVCCMVALLTIQNHVIFYQEQHNLFMWTGDYLRHTVHSEGLIYYLGAFVIQFYHIPWLGAGLVSLFAVAVYLLTESIIRCLTGKRDLLQLGVLIVVALYLTLDGIEENPGCLVAAVVCLAVVRGVLCFVKRRETEDLPLPKVKALIPMVLAAIYII